MRNEITTMVGEFLFKKKSQPKALKCTYPELSLDFVEIGIGVV
jgi:hypothetical protein